METHPVNEFGNQVESSVGPTEEQMTSHFISGVLVISITGRCLSPTQLLPSRAAVVVDSKGRSGARVRREVMGQTRQSRA